MAKAMCSSPGCVAPVRTRGYCSTDYKRLRRNGQLPLLVKPTLPERFWPMVEPDGDCWIWTGVKDQCGYGRFGGRSAHRLAYNLLVGPIPKGLTLDHLCRRRSCLNPDHLEPVTHRENVGRGTRARQQACQEGHLLTEANIYRRPTRRGWRQCRICKNRRERDRKRRIRDSTPPPKGRA